MTNQNLTDQLQPMLDKSRRSIAAARFLADEEDLDFASSRIYYAAFYAVQAALLTKIYPPLATRG